MQRIADRRRLDEIENKTQDLFEWNRGTVTGSSAYSLRAVINEYAFCGDTRAPPSALLSVLVKK